MKKIITFYIDDCLFGIESQYIHDLLPPRIILPIPQKKSQYFNQVMQIDDTRFVHVINTEKLLKIRNKPVSGESKLIILQSKTFNAGLLVDKVSTLLEVDNLAIMSHLPLSKIDSNFLSGIVTDKERVVVVLNMGVIMSTIIA